MPAEQYSGTLLMFEEPDRPKNGPIGQGARQFGCLDAPTASRYLFLSISCGPKLMGSSSPMVILTTSPSSPPLPYM